MPSDEALPITGFWGEALVLGGEPRPSPSSSISPTNDRSAHSSTPPSTSSAGSTGFLLSDDAEWINGQVWSINGGALLRE